MKTIPAALAAATAVALGLAALTAPAAHAADVVVSSASGLSIRDSDGVAIQTATPLSAWSNGNDVSTSVASVTPTSSSIKNGYTITTGSTTTTAGDTGARTSVASATLNLRARVPVSVTGLEVGCTPGGDSFVSFDSLTVDGTDISEKALAAGKNFTYDLPADSLGRGSITTLQVDTQTQSGSSKTVTGISLVDDSEMFEVSRVNLGQVTCAAHEQAELAPYRVAGVQVLSADGSRALPPTAVIDTPGAHTATVASVSALGTRSTAQGITSTTEDDGTARVTIDSFRQLPALDAFAEYRPSALKVNGLHLVVRPGGASSVTFDDPSNALFADGRWLNAGDGYIYSKLDGNGNVALEVKVNERIENDDDTVTVNAVHYIDHTGTWPEVILGQVTTSTQEAPAPAPAPITVPDEPAISAGTWNAFGIRATGASVISPAPLAQRSGDQIQKKTADSLNDGGSGQLSATGLSVESGLDGSKASVSSVSLYPGTDAEVELKDLSASITRDGIVVTSAGGTVFGAQIPAGAIEKNSVFTAPGGAARVVLAETKKDSTGLDVVAGLHFVDASGLLSDVIVASATAGSFASDVPLPVDAGAPTSAPLPDASPAPAPATSGSVRPGLHAAAVKVTTKGSVYGKRGKLSVKVSGDSSSAALSGTVAVSLDGRAPKVLALSNGTASLALPKNLRAGKHTVAAAFSGNSDLAAVRSVSSISIAKATSRTALKLSNGKKKTASSRIKATVTVTVPHSSARATGKVVITRGTKKLVTVKLVSADKGRVTVTVPKAAKKIKATYVGSSNVASSTSNAKSVRAARR